MSTRSNPAETNRTDEKPVRVYLGLGGNVGDVKTSMISAIEAIGNLPDTKVSSVSRLYKTPPWGDTDQDWFLNACVEIETRLAPLDLLDSVKAIEKNLKRQHTRRWGPRTIDIDLLVYGKSGFTHERLELPHPRMLDRSFVLKPLSDIAGNLLISGKSVAEHAKAVDQSGIEPALGDDDWWKSDS